MACMVLYRKEIGLFLMALNKSGTADYSDNTFEPCAKFR